MDVMVADTSVLMNLRRSNLLEPAFSLPFRFRIPDLIYRSVLMGGEGGSAFGDSLIRLGLDVVELDGGEVGRAIGYRRRHPSLTLPDSFALALAAGRGWTLLTDSRLLRSLAQELEVALHGVLWLIEQIYRKGTATPARLAAGLTGIRDHPRSGLSGERLSSAIERYSRIAG